MGMTVSANLGLADILRKGSLILERGGPLQMFVDSTALNGVAPYVPMGIGILSKSATLHTEIGSGAIIWKTPYARYLWYGKLMVDPVTKKGAFYDPTYGFWSRRGVQKELTDRDLVFDQRRHPLAGPKWALRYKADHLRDLSEAVQKKAGEIWNNS